jgi:ATP phosphoribosyltransferase regulatory subunit
MSSAWLLPEHMADVLPAAARRIEALRRLALDQAQRSGYELVIPPLMEHLESLLSGTGSDLELKTFKLVDQLSGRMLGLRADTTPQAARIDAHLLNREGVTRLCYCGPVLHTRPTPSHASREPLQFGAEIFGHAGLEADAEVAELALETLQAAGAEALLIDIGDARVLRAVLAGVPMDAQGIQSLAQALASKDSAAVEALSSHWPSEAKQSLRSLLRLYGGAEVLDAARAQLPARPLLDAALRDMASLAATLRSAFPGLRIGFDLADLGGYSYYSGMRFAIFADGANAALARGGRYDEVGAVFGRNRPAAGFSLDLKALAESLPMPAPGSAIRAPGTEAPGLREALRRLRAEGETVVRVLPGHEDEAQAFDIDRELVAVEGRWLVRSI